MRNQGRNQGESRRAQVVARAAAIGAQDGSRFSADQTSRFRFMALVAFVILAGTMLVGYTWSERQYDHPTTLDSWQSAYAVFDCQDETWLEPFDSRSNPDGIRSRGDGIIYIEPASDAVAGDNATLNVFLEAMGAQLSDEELTLPDGSVLSEQGAWCDGEEAVLAVHRWQQGSDDVVEKRLVDLGETNFLADGEAFAIVFAPANATVPMPPSAAVLPE